MLLLGELGGITAIQHFVLRLILYGRGMIPLRYIQFLDRSANHILLRKVGGGYVFIHRLLMEYFASLDTVRPGIALPTYAWALVQRGETRWQLGRPEEALADFNLALTLDATFLDALYNRGETYWQLGHYEEALADLNLALTRDPNSVVTLICRGWTYVRMGRYEEVLADFDRAVTPESDDWNLYSRALIYRFLGRDHEAKADLVAAIGRAQRQYVQYPEAWRIAYNLALYLLADGGYKEAEQQYRRTQPPTTVYLHEPIHDLEDFLALFPQHRFAQTMLEQLRGMKSQADLP